MTVNTTANKENVRKLVEALRSGEYEQAKSRLAWLSKDGKNFKYCCLGVACEVAKKNGLDLEVLLVDGDTSKSYDNATLHLPRRVIEWYGFTGQNPQLRREDGYYDTATHMNDQQGLDFNTIADAFEGTFLNDSE